MAELRHATPLEGLVGHGPPAIEVPGLRIAEAAVRTQILVQRADPGAGWPDLGVDLPAAPNRRTQGEPYAVWWSPESRLIVAEATVAPPAGVIAHHVGDGLAVLDVTGTAARDLLAMGCGLDFVALAEDGSARTLLAQVPVLLTRHEDGFRIHVDRALLPHLWAWATEAATALQPS